ncbi:Tetratricopeptide repeat protein [Roseimaritima multifibrata]|uniref:Tetratricopeptide repeat protein n=1 Tax=Roseimaritima multifibrata TaxID=1930274 RepID=A0A517MKQ8_9BACT|nr:tetratricopeptide repeat protein [Roseimaritima multifibrata]QDS95468.1 Tetratricopeptide repeat protein [Roseimaritima multifibrata]
MAEKSPEASSSKRPDRSMGMTAALIAVVGIASIGAFATLFTVWARSGAPGIEETLRLASEEYVAGRPAVAAKLAQTVEFPEEYEDADQIHLKEFLIGAGLAAAANKQVDLNEWRIAMDGAIPHLQASAEHGFPPGREAEGNQLLGEAFLSKGKFSKAAKYLETAIDIDPATRLQLMPLLVESQLQAAEMEPEVALQSARNLLEWETPGTIGLDNAKLLLGRALIQKEQWAAAREPIREVIDNGSDPQIVQEARLLDAISQITEAISLEEGSKAALPSPAIRTKIRKAIEDLEAIDREADPLLATRSRLWVARGLRALKENEAAIAVATTVRLHRPFNAESIAGGVLESELLASQGMGEDVLQTARYLVREIGDPRLFDGRIIRLEEFRQRMAGVADQLREAGEYRYSVDLARSLPPVLPLDQAYMLEGLALSDWAESTLENGRQSDGAMPPEVAAKARQYYRAAGDARASAAKERYTTTEYIPAVWDTIEAYEQAGDFGRTLTWVEEYLRYEKRALKPRGLLVKGRTLLALDRPEDALRPLTTCVVEHPRDSLRYEARLIAALANAELNRFVEARELLDENLYDGTLAPESKVWRDSLYLLGQLLYRDAYRNHLFLTGELPPEIQPPTDDQIQFRDNQELLLAAIGRLDETADREEILISENRIAGDELLREAQERARNARYLAARSRQMAAHWPEVESEAPDLLDVARRRLSQSRDEYLQQAADGFSGLRQQLDRSEEDQELSNQDQSMLRNCFLAEADVLRQLGKYEEAAEAYRGVSLRYMNEPASLEAMLGQAQCMEDLGRKREANLIVRQAERVLQRIPKEMDSLFVETTRYDREQWQRLFAWMVPPEVAPQDADA